MENEVKIKRERRISLIALILAFITLVVGFLAYSGTIRIEKELKGSGNNVDIYNIGFSISDNKLIPGTVEAYMLNNDMSNTMPTAEDAILYGSIVKNIRAHFYAPGQYAIYKFFVYNAGKEDLYLNDIIFKDIDFTNIRKICRPMNPNEPIENASDVCPYITLGVVSNKYSYNAIYGTVNDIKGVKIKSHKSDSITVIVAYETGAPKARTPIEINFGDIEFRYSIYK